MHRSDSTRGLERGIGVLRCCVCSDISETPVLLDCLHNCCQSCTGSAASEDGCTSFTCPKCKDVTSVSGRGWNSFAVSRLKSLNASVGFGRCDICPGDNGVDQAADHWCRECSKLLCDQCMRDHRRHVSSHTVVSLPEQVPLDRALSAASAANQVCVKHGEKCSLLCFECKTLMCCACAMQCLDGKHDVKHRDTEKAVGFLKKIAGDLSILVENLETKRSGITSRKEILDDLMQARRADFEILQTNKKALLDTVDRAYTALADLLDKKHDTLAAKAGELTNAATLLDEKVQQAVEYGRHLLESGDFVSLLQQQLLLASRLQSLMVDVRGLQPLAKPVKRFCIEGCAPNRFAELCQQWIGGPNLCSDLSCEGSDGMQLSFLQLTKDNTSNSETSALEWLLDSESKLNEDAGELKLVTTGTGFSATTKCMDIVVTSDGRLLLAAYACGLRECDASGKELSHWTAINDSVWTVDELQDKRVAAGLCSSKCVVLLRRVSASSSTSLPAATECTWVEDSRVTGLDAAPWSLSIHGNLLAIAEDYRCSQQFVLFDLSHRHSKLHRQQLEYRLWAVSVTARAVITTSWGRVQLGDGRERRVVDSYSHQGERLWRQEWTEQVEDICVSPSGHVLYLALRTSNRLTALSAEDGHEIADVVNSVSHGLTEPYRLSVCRTQPTAIFVLCSDKRTVKMYHAERVRGSN